MVSERNEGFQDFRCSMREKDEGQDAENCLLAVAGEWVLRESWGFQVIRSPSLNASVT